MSIVQAQQTTAHVEVEKIQHGQRFVKADQVAEEVPIALVYNGISHAVMLATPADLEDFALGFSLAEQIIQQPKQMFGVDCQVQAEGIALHIEIASECFQGLKMRRRSMAGRTGCGLCGAESLEQALRLPTKQVTPASPISLQAIQRALIEMPQQQPLQAATGATHACAWVNIAGEIVLLREDVGRHNALDKLVGARAKLDANQVQGFFLTSSRASYEMVQKTACADVALLVALSAPTALALRLAQQVGISLVGFARGEQLVIYTDSQGLLK
jgi:FdhD protein